MMKNIRDIKNSKIIIITICSVFIIICATLIYIHSKSDDDHTYYGTLEADEINISAETSGRINGIKVEEGQIIKQGKLVALIDSDESESKLEKSQIAIENANNELGKLTDGNRIEDIKAQEAVVVQAQSMIKQGQANVDKQSSALSQGSNTVSQAQSTVSQGQAAVSQAQNKLNIAAQNYDYKKKLYDDAKGLYESGAGTKYDMDSCQNALSNADADVKNSQYALNSSKSQLDGFNSQLQSSKSQLDGLKSQLEGAKSQLEGYFAQLDQANQKLNLLVDGSTQRDKDTAQYGIDNSQKDYNIAKSELDKCTVLSSNGGEIETVNFKPGEYVTPGNPIATMLDLDNMYVKIYVPESELLNVKLNKSVNIKCDFLKNKSITGKISYISPKSEFTPMNIVTKKDRMKLVYEIKVKIPKNKYGIKPGMLMNVKIE